MSDALTCVEPLRVQVVGLDEGFQVGAVWPGTRMAWLDLPSATVRQSRSGMADQLLSLDRFNAELAELDLLVVVASADQVASLRTRLDLFRSRLSLLFTWPAVAELSDAAALLDFDSWLPAASRGEAMTHARALVTGIERSVVFGVDVLDLQGMFAGRGLRLRAVQLQVDGAQAPQLLQEALATALPPYAPARGVWGTLFLGEDLTLGALDLLYQEIERQLGECPRGQLLCPVMEAEAHQPSLRLNLLLVEEEAATLFKATDAADSRVAEG